VFIPGRSILPGSLIPGRSILPGSLIPGRCILPGSLISGRSILPASQIPMSMLLSEIDSPGGANFWGVKLLGICFSQEVRLPGEYTPWHVFKFE